MKNLTALLLFFLLAATSCMQKAKPNTEQTKDLVSGQGDFKDKEFAVKNWFNKDSQQDGIEGASVDRAYAEQALGIKLGVKPVIVAVIDTGVDVNHEDLHGRIWVNEKEIPNNKIDDDQNGYVDDIHGWSFLGKLKVTTDEFTREVVRMKALQEERLKLGTDLTKEEKEYFEKVSKDLADARKIYQTRYDRVFKAKVAIEPSYIALKVKGALTVPFEKLKTDDLYKLETQDEEIKKLRNEMLKLMQEHYVYDMEEIFQDLAKYGDQLNICLNENANPRKDVIGDDDTDFSANAYGDNDVIGPDAHHGTHVAGIIAAVRDNNLGIRGVAHDVRIMALRAIPEEGDQYDKDVANAVRYAADNGAQIVSMSFGKEYSPYPRLVWEAFQYAESKRVLIVHSAGNDRSDNDVQFRFPQREAITTSERIYNWIEVGASGAFRGKWLPAYFSNYGQKTVDIFAPGLQVHSTFPGNKYDTLSGTSMAAPVVAGVAALVWSQYPTMPPSVLRSILLESALQYPGLIVEKPKRPGTFLEDFVLFETLSISGGIVNAFHALLRAQWWSGQHMK